MENIIKKYQRIYKLPELIHKEQVSGDFFNLYRKKHYFIIISIYNSNKEILLIRNLNKVIGWELPGGFVNDNENLEEAVNRITLKESGLEIDELCPVAIVKNVFIHDNRKITHSGIAFMALSRGNVSNYSKNFQICFTTNIPEKVVYQNKKILKIVQKQLSTYHNPPFKEIDSVKNKKFSFLYLLHKYFVKPIGNLSSQKIKKEIFNLIDGNPKIILDVSCGESSIINDLHGKYKPEICIGNDISWKVITLAKNKKPDVLFTNHNIINLPYKIKFDLVIFKNTLHHIEKESQKKILDNLKKNTNQLIVIDVEDPQKSGLRSKLWNDYYVHLLGDQGDSFLNFDEFKQLIGSKRRESSVKTNVGIINTIKGRYFYASIKTNKTSTFF